MTICDRVPEQDPSFMADLLEKPDCCHFSEDLGDGTHNLPFFVNKRGRRFERGKRAQLLLS